MFLMARFAYNPKYAVESHSTRNCSTTFGAVRLKTSNAAITSQTLSGLEGLSNRFKDHNMLAFQDTISSLGKQGTGTVLDSRDVFDEML